MAFMSNSYHRRATRPYLDEIPGAAVLLGTRLRHSLASLRTARARRCHVSHDVVDLSPWLGSFLLLLASPLRLCRHAPLHVGKTMAIVSSCVPHVFSPGMRHGQRVPFTTDTSSFLESFSLMIFLSF